VGSNKVKLNSEMKALKSNFSPASITRNEKLTTAEQTRSGFFG
jgi:hypothetical protein